MLVRSLVLTCAAVVAVSSAVSAKINMNIKDANLGTTYRFAGIDLRVMKVETVAKVDGRPIAVKADLSDRDKGYFMVTVSMQNPSASEDMCIPGQNLGFELKDGSQIDESAATHTYLSPSLAELPGRLHPKQHINVIYLFDRWNGQPLTKMFVKNNSGCGENDRGLGYLRFQLSPTAVTALDPQT